MRITYYAGHNRGTMTLLVSGLVALGGLVRRRMWA